MKYTVLAFFLGLSIFSWGQNPVSWQYSAKKLANQTYEIHLTATIQNPWHVYSQFTPEGGPVPTKISFTQNPLVAITGPVKEVGKLHQKHEEVFGVDVKYFDGTVDFVQVIQLKTKIKTNINGSISFMVCNDEQCLPPKTIPFSVKIE